MNPKMLIAARWMLTDRELRPFLWRPVLLGIGLYALLLAVSLATILPWGMAVLRAWGWPDWLAILAFGYGWLMGSGVMLTTLIVMVSGPQFDRLSRLIEVRMGRVPVEIPRRNAGRDNLARMAFSFLGGFVVMLSGVCLPVVGPLLLGGHLAWVDLTGPALTRRGESLGTSLRRCGTLPGRWPWKLLYGWAGIVAGLNAILLPIWVAAATALVVESDKRADFLGKDDCIR